MTTKIMKKPGLKKNFDKTQIHFEQNYEKLLMLLVKESDKTEDPRSFSLHNSLNVAATVISSMIAEDKENENKIIMEIMELLMKKIILALKHWEPSLQ